MNGQSFVTAYYKSFQEFLELVKIYHVLEIILTTSSIELDLELPNVRSHEQTSVLNSTGMKYIALIQIKYLATSIVIC